VPVAVLNDAADTGNTPTAQDHYSDKINL